MRRISVEEISNRVQPATVMRSLTKPLGVTDLAINYYKLDPGDSFAFAYHNHEIQEEVFFVIEGTASFDTEEGEIDIGPNQAIRFDRGEFQRGWNRGDSKVIALALGAPLEYGTMIKLRYCARCGDRTDNTIDTETMDGETIRVAYCKECGAETGRWFLGHMEGTVP